MPTNSSAPSPAIPISVVVIDDSEDLVFLVRGALERSGQFSVVAEAADGEQGVLAVSATQPDLVLLDIAMPVMDGLEATTKIREVDPHACVLMLTGSNAREDVNRARRAGAAGYVTKDRIAAELIDAILEVASR